MIAHLRGTVLEKGAADAVIDVGGVGYRVNLSSLSLLRLPPEGQAVQVRVQTVVREDALDLFGFLSRGEEEMFLKLTSVSQVGPRLALAVLSGMEVEELAHALRRSEVGRLTRIHGVGKKTAERLVLELKDKVGNVTSESRGAPAVPAGGVAEDVLSALVNHGYKEVQAEKVVRASLERLGPAAAFDTLFRDSLKLLRMGGRAES